MSIHLGPFGIWQPVRDTTPETAKEVEGLGFGALWIGGSPDGGLHEIEALLDATETIPVATGIVNMWRDDAETVASSYHRIDERHPGRFLLGVGIGHPEATREYHQPYDTIIAYLEALDRAAVPSEHVVLAALGPRALRVAAKRTAGAHPYLTTRRHTRRAREIMGDGPLLAPGHAVIVNSDRAEANRAARDFVARYLRLVNYRSNLVREGWDEAELENGGSDRLVDELVLSGSADEVVEGLRSHIEAGADHVNIQVLDPDPVPAYRALAAALGLKSVRG